MNEDQAELIRWLKEKQVDINGGRTVPASDTCTCDKTPRCPCCGKKLPAGPRRAKWQINLPGSPTY